MDNKWRRGWPLSRVLRFAAFVHPCTSGFSPFGFERHPSIILSAGAAGPCGKNGGEGGIRTHVGLAPPTDFESRSTQ